MDVILEVGKKKVFANALDWPGWGRGGRGEAAALQALLDYAPRYAAAIAAAISPTGLDFNLPGGIGDFVVLRSMEGNASTDYGVPGVIPEEDKQPVGEDELARLQALLQACWHALENAGTAAEGKELQKGPRGGGRNLEGIMRHVLDAQAGYLGSIGVKVRLDPGALWQAELPRCTRALLDGLAASAHGELPAQGPRGGVYWPARYLARRSAWHILDHAWEIEDRAV